MIKMIKKLIMIRTTVTSIELWLRPIRSSFSSLSNKFVLCASLRLCVK